MDIEHVIVYAFQDSLFPELIECFGLDGAVEFIKIFGGTTIVVPTVDNVRHIMRDYDIFMCMRKAAEKTECVIEKTIKDLCTEYLMTRKDLETIYQTMCKVAESGIESKVRGWSSRTSTNRSGGRPNGFI